MAMSAATMAAAAATVSAMMAVVSGNHACFDASSSVTTLSPQPISGQLTD